METTRKRLDELKPHPRNYRKHPEDQLAHIKASIQANGFYRNVVVAEDMTILAGHGVVEAARELGLGDVPVVILPIGPNDPKALKVLTGDNAISFLAMDDDRELTEILRMVKDDDGLLGTGFDDQQLAALLLATRPEHEIPDAAAAAEWVGMPEYDEGADRIRLIVSFPTKEDRDAFLLQTDLRIHKKERLTWSTRWPWSENIDRTKVRLESKR